MLHSFSLFTCDVINILECKIAQPPSFQVFSFFWLLNIYNVFLFEGFQLESSFRFNCRAFSISKISLHRTSKWQTECVTYFWKQNSYPVIFSNLNSQGIVKSVHLDICYFQRANGSIFIEWISDVFIVFWRFHTELYNLCETFWRITWVRNIAQISAK